MPVVKFYGRSAAFSCFINAMWSGLISFTTFGIIIDNATKHGFTLDQGMGLFILIGIVLAFYSISRIKKGIYILRAY